MVELTKQGRRQGLTFLKAMAATIFAALLLAAPAFAASTLDQQQTLGIKNVFYWNHLTAQSFTAGQSGVLEKVSLYVASTNASATLHLELRTIDPVAGTPTSEVLARSSAAGAWDIQWRDFSLSPAPRLQSGERYALVVYISGVTSGQCYQWCANWSDLYQAGTSWTAWGQDPWADRYTADFCFMTYMAADEPPATVRDLGIMIGEKAHAREIEPRMENSLLAKVDAAQAALDRGNTNSAKVAMNNLKALLSEVNAQTGKQISADAAVEIITQANKIIAALARQNSI